MYRVFLFIAFLAYGSSVPFPSSALQRPSMIQQNDDSELVDNVGAGYSYFKKQEIQARPLTKSSFDIPNVDLSAYFQGSALNQLPNQNQIFSAANNALNQLPNQNQIFSAANNVFGQQQLIPRSNIPIQNLLPKTIQNQQPNFIQRDFSQLPSTISNGFSGQQAYLPTQSKLLATNTFNNPQQKTFNGYSNQQQDLSFVPQQTLNNYGNQQQDLSFVPQQTFNNYDNQQQDVSFMSQPQQTWSNQQQSVSFSSSSGGQGQQPVSSGFIIQSSQENDQQPITNVVFMSSQVPPQRFISQSQPKQQTINYGF